MQTEQDEVRARKRVVLMGAVVTIALFFAFPVLAFATPALDGVVDGVGVVYLVGVVEILGATLAAMVYNHWVNRAEER
jgi:uncharacterized membrane protein (DUF485 family)